MLVFLPQGEPVKQGYIARIFTSFIDIPHEVSTSIYFSGCSIRCPQCHNKELWDKENGTLMSDAQIMEKVNNALTDYVAFLGGEPTDQLDFLLHLTQKIKNETNKKITLYTGREFENLPEELLKKLEMVVCGPYRHDMRTGGWPASSNQRVFKKENGSWKKQTEPQTLGQPKKVSDNKNQTSCRKKKD